ncbi:RNA-directed DNA polymerase, eukaryota [Tanacetum coccineum]
MLYTEATRWIKFVPIKVNVLALKVMIDALPTRLNISRCGIGISSLSCPICDCGVESTDHLFFRCTLVKQLGHKSRSKASFGWNEWLKNPSIISLLHRSIYCDSHSLDSSKYGRFSVTGDMDFIGQSIVIRIALIRANNLYFIGQSIVIRIALIRANMGDFL